MVDLLKIKSAWSKATVHKVVAGLLLASVAFSAFGVSRGISVAVRESEMSGSPVLQNVELYSSSYALVIGNDLYNNGWPPLSNGVKDAELVAGALEDRGFEVELLRNLTSSELDSAFKRFFILQGDEPEARLFVWYAGHGATIEGEGYLIPIDAPIPSVGSHFKLASIPLRDFGTYMRQSTSKHVFAVFDSCFAGTVFSSQRNIPPVAITLATTKPVRQFLTSGDADQTVSDDGNFRDLFIKAISGEERADLNGDGYVTGSELGMFLADRVTNLTQSMQTPRYGKLRDKKFDRGDFVFKLPVAETATLRSEIQTQAPAAQYDSAEIEFWNAIKNSKSAEQYGAYLKTYPTGSFAELAKIREKEFTRRKPSVVRAPPIDFEISYRDENYIASNQANIRGLPYRGSEKVGRLEEGELVWVVGESRVRDETWFRIARNGLEIGFVHASLLEQTDQQYASERPADTGESAIQGEVVEVASIKPIETREVDIVPAGMDRWSAFADELETANSVNNSLSPGETIRLQVSEPAVITEMESVSTEGQLPETSGSEPRGQVMDQLEQQMEAISNQQLQIVSNEIVVSEQMKPHLQAARSGDINEQFLVGYMYQEGVKTEADALQAVYWYEKAATAGHMEAQLRLGLMLENGEGQAKNLKQAIHWYREAAGQGNADAQQLLGYFYETGQGVSADMAKALEYYTAAAVQGRVIAQVNLGRIYQLGLSAEANPEKAIYWYEKAASQGNEDALKQLALLTEVTTSG